MKRLFLLFSPLALVILLFLPTDFLNAFAYIFAGEANGEDVITHPIGYSGAGGTLTVTVGIDPTTANVDSMVEPVQNVINTFNTLTPSTGNVLLGGANNIPGGFVDFESTLLHELGHSLGLAHVNAATESGLAGDDRNYTKATDGVNNAWDIAWGGDGIRGSEDDVRGDDDNLHYFKMSDNDPFTIAGTVDNTTYSRDVADLPVGDLFPTNADRTVSADKGYGSTEAVMQQGAFADEDQRALGHDDVAGIRYAESGLDETAGTADDYDLVLSYAGLTTSADIVIDFDNAQTGFAVSQSGGAFLSADHVVITTNNIYFNTGFSWFFNTTPVLPVEWVHFAVQKEDKDAILHWTTAEEVNVDFFEIERSTDRENWHPVGKVYADQRQGALRNYLFSDVGIGNRYNHLYYRVKESDLSGGFSYSQIREIQFERTESEIITFGPIPVRTYSYVAMHLMQAEPIQLRIVDLGGRIADQWKVDGRLGYQEIAVGSRILQLAPGNYVLEVSSPSVRQQIKFVR